MDIALGSDLSPLARFAGLALIFVPLALPWQYFMRQTLVDLEPGRTIVVYEPAGTIYPIDTHAQILLYVGIAITVALVFAPSRWVWAAYAIGGLVTLAALKYSEPITLELLLGSGWRGLGRAIIESEVIWLGLIAYGFALLVADRRAVNG